MKLTLIDIPEYKANAWTAQAMARLPPRYTGVPNSIEIRAKLGRKEQKAHLRLSLTRKADFSSENCLILFVGNSPRILAGPKEGVIHRSRHTGRSPRVYYLEQDAIAEILQRQNF